MALLSAQSISTVMTPTFAAVNSSDTIDVRTLGSNAWLHIKVGGTATTITLTPGGNQEYTDVAKSGLQIGPVTSADRIFRIPKSIGHPTTGIVTVAYTSTTAVTSALLQM